jgi:hypothetical protein
MGATFCHVYSIFVSVYLYPYTERKGTAMFKIWIRTAGGDELEAFLWTRSAAAGIERAWKEAHQFGFDIVAAWAVAV